MKKVESVRLYNFSDAQLVLTANEKASFMQRDAAAFVPYGITAAVITDFIAEATSFADYLTDWEAAADQTQTTLVKNQKAEDLRVALRELMVRVERKFVYGSPKHTKFRTNNLSKQQDAELSITAKVAVRSATQFLTELEEAGVTPALVTALETLSAAYDVALVNQLAEIGNRDVLREKRVEKGNALYTRMVSYTNTGQAIWETTNEAKYNDYIIYDDPSGNSGDQESAE